MKKKLKKLKLKKKVLKVQSFKKSLSWNWKKKVEKKLKLKKKVLKVRVKIEKKK